MSSCEACGMPWSPGHSCYDRGAPKLSAAIPSPERLADLIRWHETQIEAGALRLTADTLDALRDYQRLRGVAGAKHEQRVVGHASGYQERIETCICGKPWPCVDRANEILATPCPRCRQPISAHVTENCPDVTTRSPARMTEEERHEIREEAMQDCWNAVDDLIVTGHLEGIWRNEQRNGFVLATNAITALIDKERAKHQLAGDGRGET